MRVGFGYDVHRLVPERSLILGGVEVPYDLGLLGHSDADVLVHAIMDALLGAAGEGDIGRHFPDTDPAYKGISSLALLGKVGAMLKAKRLQIVNLDSTIVAQQPKLMSYILPMVENVSRILEIKPSQVNIKATTTEGLGFTGTGEGIAAYAVASLSYQVVLPGE